MKFSITSLALVAGLLAMCLCQIQANDDDKSTTPATYFGVDANDKEAVLAKQRELSADKFRELFGDEAHEEFNRHEEDEKATTEKPEENAWSNPMQKMVALIKHGQELMRKKLEEMKQSGKKE